MYPKYTPHKILFSKMKEEDKIASEQPDHWGTAWPVKEKDLYLRSADIADTLEEYCDKVDYPGVKMVSKDLHYNHSYPTEHMKDGLGGLHTSDVDWDDNLQQKSESAPTPPKMQRSVLHEYAHRDEVENPEHYKLFPDMEVIDLLRKVLTREEFIGYCKGNVLKYKLRTKGEYEKDRGKAEEYQKYLQDSMETNEPSSMAPRTMLDT